MTSKKDQEETLKSFIQKHSIGKGGISKAPPPINPLSGYGYIPPKASIPKPIVQQKKLFVPVTGTELMKKWSVGWEAIFDFARQEYLTPSEPKDINWRINYDFGMLSNIDFPKEEREEYFSQWLYQPNDIEAFQKKHGDILDEWREKVVPKGDKETRQTINKQDAEIKKQIFREAGHKGGCHEKKNLFIIEAIKKFMKMNPKNNNYPNRRIAGTFRKKHQEKNPISVIVDGNTWEVFCKDEYVFSVPCKRADGKIIKEQEKSIAYSTFEVRYIRGAKKSITEEKLS